jgi:hypothetical protein
MFFAELRNLIWFFTSLSTVKNSGNLRFLLTCRQVYFEAATIAFSNTTFSLNTKYTVFFIEKLSSLPPQKARAIKHLEVHEKLVCYTYVSTRVPPPGPFFIKLDNFKVRPEAITVRYKWAPLSLPFELDDYGQKFIYEAYRNCEIFLTVCSVPSIKTVILSIKKGIPEGALEAVRKGLIVFLNPWKEQIAPEPFYNHDETILHCRLLAGQYLERFLSPEMRPRALNLEVGRIRGSLTDNAVQFSVKFTLQWGSIPAPRDVTFVAIQDPS